MEEVKRLIESDDQKLKLREQKLIQKINVAYEKAVKEAMKEFKYLERLNPDITPTHVQVKKILAKALVAFQKEYESLVEPIREAMKESYEEGLGETGQILAALDRKKGIESKS